MGVLNKGIMWNAGNQDFGGGAVMIMTRFGVRP